ncbi:PTS system IIA component (Glc family) [Streptohalobacillus salinus]|uniref:PTS system IIA component (Glc family) n=1 Tax=Streptohalobacillus salinus TaxID=621096 RepID=A0A2V3VXZ9_9BACI|nr:PTS system IIA component (Glc family) [Streptohalobacillus salinus]
MKNTVITSPFKGLVKKLETIDDTAFASGAIGQGIAIEPEEGKVYAPVAGTVTTLFPTHHAIGITSDEGAEVLIHVGMDTVRLEGEHFTAHIKQGDRVEIGQLLLEFDQEKIEAAGYSLITPVVVTNFSDYDVVIMEQTEVEMQDLIMELRAK